MAPSQCSTRSGQAGREAGNGPRGKAAPGRARDPASYDHTDSTVPVHMTYCSRFAGGSTSPPSRCPRAQSIGQVAQTEAHDGNDGRGADQRHRATAPAGRVRQRGHPSCRRASRQSAPKARPITGARRNAAPTRASQGVPRTRCSRRRASARRLSSSARWTSSFGSRSNRSAVDVIGLTLGL
jgi:hypothetical protein